MIRQEKPLSPEHASRRRFLKTSLAAAAIGTLPLARTAHAAGSDIIRIGLIGCGNRGPGAAVNAMNVDPGVRLVAMADIFADHVHSRRALLKREKPSQVDVDDTHCFSGLDGYRHVIESVDVVLIACAAKYHCVYLLAAVEAGKHAFVEKPHAIDPVGVRQIIAAGEIAKRKNLSVLSGLHCRFYPGFQETVSASMTARSATSLLLKRRSSAALTTSSIAIPSSMKSSSSSAPRCISPGFPAMT